MAGSQEHAVNETLWEMPVRLAADVPERKTRHFGTVRACYGALSSPAVNRIFIFEQPDRRNLDAATEWLAEHDVPFQVTVTAAVASEMEADLAAMDLEETDESPGMARPSLEDMPDSEAHTTISEVTTREQLEEYVEVGLDVFEFPPSFADQLRSQAVLTDEAFTFLIARRDDQPVACGQLLRKDDIAGVFFIGVRPEFRRQGLGKAMTWAVLRAGHDQGCTRGVLDSSEMGYPLYREMGFETVVEYQHYEPVGQAGLGGPA